MGLGRFGGGVGVARYLAEQGAEVLVTDKQDLEELADSVAQLEGLPISFRLGQHDEHDFRDADMVVVNPAVNPQRNLYLEAARRGGAIITTEIKLLVEQLPNRQRTIGVTGTAGKSTTVAMIGHVLERSTAIADHVWVGGNIGFSLLPLLKRIERDDWVVLELSSFMLDMVGDWSPHIAVVTNMAPNHLDRHHTVDAYVHAKQTILRHQKHSDRAVLGPGLAEWNVSTPAMTVIEEEPIDVTLAIPGDHNHMNATLAIAACECIGLPRERTTELLADFKGLPHRLQLVTEHHGVRYFNDSKCTIPEAAMLAIDCFEANSVHAILGGHDKKCDLTELAQHAAATCQAVYTIGATGETIADKAEKFIEFEGHHCRLDRCETLERAVTAAHDRATPGDVVLLSPGCASWDQFTNFEARGDAFAKAVHSLTT